MNTQTEQQPQSPGSGQTLPPIASILPHESGEPIPIHGGAPHGANAGNHVDPRDSGHWSASKHSSAVSNTGFNQLQSILNASDSPSRNSMPETPASGRPNSLAPPHSGSQNLDPRASVDASSLLDDSRRSSVDSRMNAGMTQLGINPTSPYDSANVSRTSLANSLQQQRGIIPDARQNGLSPLSPLVPRMPGSNGIIPRQPRIAPVIQANPRSVSGMPDPTGPEPLPGYAWAFPDTQDGSDGARRSSSGSSEDLRPSRQNSYATSVTSSLYDGRLPEGQKRFSDEQHTHHHSLQHRSITNLQGDNGPSGSTGNYSRTPELRISHKMAERKRRSEMKGLFDDLNNILPQTTGGKSSKWETLTRAIEHITKMRNENTKLNHQTRDVDRHRHDAEIKNHENRLLQEEITAMRIQLQRLDPNHPHVYGAFTDRLAHEQMRPMPAISGGQQAGPASWQPSGPVAPTHSAAQAVPPPPQAMQGVEYGNRPLYGDTMRR